MFARFHAIYSFYLWVRKRRFFHFCLINIEKCWKPNPMACSYIATCFILAFLVLPLPGSIIDICTCLLSKLPHNGCVLTCVVNLSYLRGKIWKKVLNISASGNAQIFNLNLRDPVRLTLASNNILISCLKISVFLLIENYLTFSLRYSTDIKHQIILAYRKNIIIKRKVALLHYTLFRWIHDGFPSLSCYLTNGHCLGIKIDRLYLQLHSPIPNFQCKITLIFSDYSKS